MLSRLAGSLLRAQPLSESASREAAASRRGLGVLLLALAVAAAGYARATLSPLQETLRLALALTDNQVAVLQGPAMALPMAMAAIPVGLAIDRFSRIRLLLILAMLDALGTVLTGLSTGFAMLLAARCLVGLAASATFPVALSLAADVCVASHRGRATTALAIGEVGGVSAAFALGGTLLTALGCGPGSWRWTMLWLTLPLVLIAIVSMAMREPPRTEILLERPSLRETGPELWRFRASLAPLLAGKIMVGTAYGAVLIWTAPTFSRSFHWAPDRIGALMATALTVSGLLGPIVGGALADHAQRTGGPRRTMAIVSGVALLSAPASLYSIVPWVPAASSLLIALMTLILVIGVMEMTLSTVVIPNELRGLSLSLLIAAGLIFGTGLAPLTVSLLSTALGGPTMIGHALAVVCVTTALLGSLTFGLGSRYFAQRA